MSESSIRTIFRVCVVNAVRRGESLMEALLKDSQAALVADEAAQRNVQERQRLADALRLLREQEAVLIKAYPMALLEIFADGPEAARKGADSGILDFGELSIMDDADMQVQMEFSRAQQSAMHATDAALSELNTLVSAAQGLPRVQPERNPLRPESYIRALQRVVSDVGVPGDVRQVWMQYLRDRIGPLLSDEYKSASQALRAQGVQPVGYAVLGTPAGGARHSQYGGGYAHSGGYGDPHSGYSRSGTTTGWNSGYTSPEAEEAMLTVGLLRQMLAAEPIDSRMGLGASTHGALVSGYYNPQGVAAAEAMDDIAQLERLVGRLAQAPGSHSQSAPLMAGWRGQPQAMPGVVYAAAPQGMESQGATMAEEVVSRMVEHIVQDGRLKPSVQRAVRNLEPALLQLVRYDARFFEDDTHPARRLLDEVTERSCAFSSESDPGFSRFMRVVNEAVVHLSGLDIRDATPFASVLTALEAAWSTQAQKEQQAQAARDAQQQAQLQAQKLSDRRTRLAEQVASNIRKLRDIGQVPDDVMDFTTGAWAEVIAHAQLNQGEGRGDDPGGYLALVPELFWSVQPALVGTDTQRLSAVLPGLQATLQRGLQSVGRSQMQIDAFLLRLETVHDEVIAAALAKAGQAEPALEGLEGLAGDAPDSLAPVDTHAVMLEQASAPAPAEAASAAPAAEVDPHPEFRVGAWVELASKRGPVRTQLTWASPHKTLFLFTAQDNSTQSMTRRVRDKLLAEGSLRVLPGPPSSEGRSSRSSRNSRSSPLR
jgi:hypothetical protein